MADILVVDDEPPIRDAMRAILERDGHAVREEPDGRQVAAAVAARRPDIVIIDMRMPGMNGGDTIAALRRAQPAIRILAISGDLGLEDALRLGADAVLSKPFRSAELRHAVTGLLKA